MTAIEQEAGPPRPGLPPMRGTRLAGIRDADPHQSRPPCSVQECKWKGAMSWFGVPFCTTHAPRRRPGLPGWERI